MLLAACGDPATSVQPPPEPPPPPSPPVEPAAQIDTLHIKSEAPGLVAYDTTFSVVQGDGHEFILEYDSTGVSQSPENDRWFLKLVLPSEAKYVDSTGRAVAQGDTAQITVRVKQGRFAVELGPDGTQFPSNPAALMFNYGFADVGAKNVNELFVWYQPESGQQWTAQRTTIDRDEFTIIAELEHFSNYAVAW